MDPSPDDPLDPAVQEVKALAVFDLEGRARAKAKLQAGSRKSSTAAEKLQHIFTVSLVRESTRQASSSPGLVQSLPKLRASMCALPLARVPSPSRGGEEGAAAIAVKRY
jgi:hypothetical protein